MLVLSRKKNEAVVINNDITVVVIEIRDDKVRLGISVPRDVPVHRQEVYDAIHAPRPPAPTPAPAPPPVVAPPPPPTVRVTQGQQEWLDRVAAALRARSGGSIDKSALAQAILDVGIKQLTDEAQAK